jgi:serine/threonine protein kinase/Tol biopolymer transport system component
MGLKPASTRLARERKAGQTAGTQVPVMPADADHRALSIGTVLGPYEVVSLLGMGGMGEVYRARDTRLQRDVAIKVLLPSVVADPDLLARFAREARVLASLNHPNIAQVRGLEESSGVPALVMELVEGPTLADRIAQGPIPLDEARRIATQIAEALEAAHDQHIVHRDLKPANIKVRPDGTVKVLDFGLAKPLAMPGPDVDECLTHTAAAMTSVGQVVGTAAYMSPEQARGGDVDRRSDIWAFGCVLFELLTGRRAFPGKDRSEIIASVLMKEPEWDGLPAAVPAVVAAFLRRALEKDPKKRLRDIGDMRLALEGAFDTPVDTSRAASRGERRLQTGRRAAWVGSAVAASVVTGLVVASLNTGSDPRMLSFFVDPPDGSDFGGATMLPMPALSRDGRQVAFAAPFGTRQVIWVQAVGSVRARPLKGTEGASFPFWSPDGSFVGFNQTDRAADPDASASLKKIAVAGDSPPQELCSCHATSGGSWGADGRFIFASPDGIARVSANGGTPVRVTTIEPSRGESSHRYPVLLPDGRRFLYLIRSTEEQHRGVFLGSIDDVNLKRRLVPDDSNAALGVGDDGRTYLFFVRDLTLMAQEFDLDRSELRGRPVVVARPLIPGETGRLAPFAVSGRTLLYRHTLAAQSEMHWVDRRGVSEGVIGAEPASDRHLMLSVDGSRIAVSRLDPGTGKHDIWIINRQRGITERITRDPVGASFPHWSPDGKTIVFASARAGPWDVYKRPADGTGADQNVFVALSPLLKYPSDMTRDGRFLLFQDGGITWALGLTDNKPPFEVVQGQYGRVSPDQRWLAYTSGTGPERQVYVTAFPRPGQRWRISPRGGTDPQWRGDGRELYYIDGDSLLTAASVRSDAPFDVASSVALFRVVSGPVVAPGRRYAPAADGQHFVVLRDLRPEQTRLSVRINWTLEVGSDPNQ